MRRRTVLLAVTILLVGAFALYQVVFRGAGLGAAASEANQAQTTPVPATPGPTATPEIPMVPVVVALRNLPVGERLTTELIGIEMRPEENVAVQAGVVFSNTDSLAGSILKTEVAAGQEILRPMLALSPNDLATLGSDLALYVDQGEVAIAFPIDRYSGLAYAMRPGDLVDVLMSLELLELDEAFQSALPNLSERVVQSDLEGGTEFILEAINQGRMEPLTLAGGSYVVEIFPGAGRVQVPRRVTQLTIQQVEVLWMGTWVDPHTGERQFSPTTVVSDAPASLDPAVTPVPTRERPEDRPDLVIMSMTAQDALVLKWALEVGIEIDLALRAQGDTTTFETTSVSLPQMVEQGGLTIPEPGEFGLDPRLEEVPTPGVPALPPGN